MATKDINGVREADAVIIVMNDLEYSYRGSFTELGTALALNKPVLMVSPGSVEDSAGFKTNVFWHHPAITYASKWDAALAWVNGLAGKGQGQDQGQDQEQKHRD